MNKKLYSLICILGLMIAMIAAFSVTSQTSIVYAQELSEVIDGEEPSDEPIDIPEEEEDTTEIEQQVYDDMIRGGYAVDVRTDIEDSHLYSALLQLVKDYIVDNYGISYTSTTLYSTMFKRFKDITITDMGITSLKGLENFKFNELETFSITNNSITTIDKKLFENMPKLKNLDLGSNDITAIDFGFAVTLENINLSSNELSAVDFSLMESPNLNINLANNKFTSMKKIALPTRVNSIKLNLISNNITDLTNEYFDYSKLTMNLGFQGIRQEKSTQYDTTNPLKFYKTNIDGVEVNIYKINTLEDVLVKTIKDSDIVDGNSIDITGLEVGEYYFEYVKDGDLLYVKGDSQKEYFKTYKFTILPAQATFKFEFKGKIYDSFPNKVTGKVKVMIDCEEGAEITYSVNGREWQKGNEVMCDKGGNYSISVKVVKDGVESNVKTVIVRTSLNTIVPDFVMLILILLFTLVLFVIVVPYVSKKFFRN